jgi:hypothetical protein
MKKGNVKIIISATQQVQNLWEKVYFKTAQSLSAVDEHLGKSDYHFTPSELAMALTRASFLTRKGRRGTYTYIQKGPFVKQDE